MNNFLNLSVYGRLKVGLLALLAVTCTCLVRPVFASDWYLGIGAGVSSLEPELLDSPVTAENTRGTYAGFLLGKAISETFSAEAHLHLPGRGEAGEVDVDYSVFDLALRYRVLDFSTLGPLGTDAFVLGGFGSVQRDSEDNIELENDSRFHFSLGLGAETRLSPAVSVRAQVLYLDEDVQTANVSLLWHWGENTTNGAGVSPKQDSDGDGVSNRIDQCDGSTAGFPVRKNGCPLFSGQLAGVAFNDRSSTLQSSAYVQLDALVKQLGAYPDAAIELIAHTDSRGTLRDQTILTRERLRIIASYLSKNGIRANRLVLRSMGGSQPVFDNNSPEGRARNNRIEIFEYTR